MVKDLTSIVVPAPAPRIDPWLSRPAGFLGPLRGRPAAWGRGREAHAAPRNRLGSAAAARTRL